MELVVNAVVVSNVHIEPFMEEITGGGYSRALLLRLSQGDTMHIRVPSGYAMFSAYTSESMFSGFLLHY